MCNRQRRGLALRSLPLPTRRRYPENGRLQSWAPERRTKSPSADRRWASPRAPEASAAACPHRCRQSLSLILLYWLICLLAYTIVLTASWLQISVFIRLITTRQLARGRRSSTPLTDRLKRLSLCPWERT